MRDEDYMEIALALAREAGQAGEVPVGAVLVKNGDIIAKAANAKETTIDATAHAELLALQMAAQKLQTWNLRDLTMYVTLEPCVMCVGAMVNARLGKLVYGAGDAKAGAAGSIFDIARCPALNHQIQVEGGVLKKECSELLSSFFMNLRRDGRVGRRRSTRNRVGG